MPQKKAKPVSLLESFMKEHFPYGEFKRAGIFTKDMKGDYEAQAARICGRLGLKSIYEYRSEEIRCHLTYVDGHRPHHVDNSGELRPEPFITVIPSIYE